MVNLILVLLFCGVVNGFAASFVIENKIGTIDYCDALITITGSNGGSLVGNSSGFALFMANHSNIATNEYGLVCTTTSASSGTASGASIVCDIYNGDGISVNVIGAEGKTFTAALISNTQDTAWSYNVTGALN